MSRIVKVVGISGSLRKGSFNTSLLAAASSLLPDGMEIKIAEIGNLPLYNADLEEDNEPEVVRRFRELLSAGDGFVLASPEYNYSIPGTLKNAIDWASRASDSPLVGKPVALMGASPGLMGTARMQLAFRPVFQYLNMIPVNKPEVIVMQAHKKFDSEGHLIDEHIIEIVRKQLLALKALVVQQQTISEISYTTN